jgi:hypothetical protein
MNSDLQTGIRKGNILVALVQWTNFSEWINYSCQDLIIDVFHNVFPRVYLIVIVTCQYVSFVILKKMEI